jgi:hypothetical protein
VRTGGLQVKINRVLIEFPAGKQLFFKTGCYGGSDFVKKIKRIKGGVVLLWKNGGRREFVNCPMEIKA